MENIMNMLISNEVGIWIECCNPDCKKWRYSLDFNDPLAVPKIWYCFMNSDQSTNTCSAPECIELENGEIFVESKFKAGCIVWAKVIGRPWSPAMVDFCPEFECYYWFDNVNTNIPSQYHVTFLNRKRITRAWIKSAFFKPFLGNEDPSFALKAKVRGKRITAQQQVRIIEGCEIAQAAMRLTISSRLKKYNFNSWRLSQRFQSQFTASGKKPAPPQAGQISKQISQNIAGTSNTNNRTVFNHKQAKNLAKNPSGNTLCQNVQNPTPRNTDRFLSARNKESVQKNVDEKKPSIQKKLISTVQLANQAGAETDTIASVETLDANIERQDDTEDLHDTESIKSFDSEDFLEVPSKGRFTAVKKKVVKVTLDDRLPADIYTNKKSCNNKTTKVATKMLDEIIPSSQNSIPHKYSLNRLLREYNKGDTISNNKRQLMGNSDDEVMTEELEIMKSSPEYPASNKLSLKLKSMNEEKRRRFNAAGHESVSQNLMASENKKNHPEKSRYLRALSEFMPKEQNPLLTTNSFQPRKIPIPKPLPDWFLNLDKRRMAETKRLDRISKLSEEEDSRMYKENRESFIAEIASTSATANVSSLRESSGRDMKKRGHFVQAQNYCHLLTSDDESI